MKDEVLLIDADTKKCSRCKTIRPLVQFAKDKKSNDNRSYWCKPCVNELARMRHIERYYTDVQYKRAKRNTYVMARHGINLEQYEGLLEKQNYKCFICQVDLRKHSHFGHLDHDHETGLIRHFLCTNCNRGLGHFQDSLNILHRALEYLIMHKENARTLKEGRCL